MNVRTLCLAILYFQEATGYEIRKLATDGKYSHFVDASFGSIYPALGRLEAEGFVTFRQEAEVGKPSRKIYTITESGRQHFMESLKEPVSKDIFRSEFLMIAMCAEFLDRETVEKAIEQRHHHLDAEIALLKEYACEDCAPDGTKWAASYGLACMTKSKEFLEENTDALLSIAGSSIENTSAPKEAAE